MIPSDALSQQNGGEASEKRSKYRGTSEQNAGGGGDTLPPPEQEVPAARAYARRQPRARWIGGSGARATQLGSVLLGSSRCGCALVNKASTELVFFMAEGHPH